MNTTVSRVRASGTSTGAPVRDYLIAAALQQIELVRYFIEVEGLHPDVTWNGKPTAISYAAMQRNATLLEYLCDSGADVNRADALGMTPLMYSTLAGWTYGVAYLIAQGAELNRVNGRCETALLLARQSANRAECAELLYRHGARDCHGPPEAWRFH